MKLSFEQYLRTLRKEKHIFLLDKRVRYFDMKYLSYG